jgi:hypothetical protein
MDDTVSALANSGDRQYAYYAKSPRTFQLTAYLVGPRVAAQAQQKLTSTKPSSHRICDGFKFYQSSKRNFPLEPRMQSKYNTFRTIFRVNIALNWRGFPAVHQLAIRTVA